MEESTAFHRGGNMAEWDPLVNEIFVRAIEAGSASERADVLDRMCGGDVELRRKVEALLLVHDGAGSFLEHPAPGLASPRSVASGEGATEPSRPSARSSVRIDEKTEPFGSSSGSGGNQVARPLTEGPGTRIGPYKLLEQIGEGGMGVVYMAEQEAPVRRKVAIKIIKPGMDTGQVVARFEAERQALALMDHPSIAKVFDAGSTSTGRPFFAMELVNGVPITEYCDRAQLAPRERLELFVSVCRTIQHAHQKGIIHRDVKPSNVLVTLVDGRPTPKVIDFGVAKATGQRLTERSLFTQFGAIVGTLEYMSPEQAELSSQDVDTRSDVFSLGVLLYELLTGSTPLERARLREAGYAEILRLIREEDPPRPSTRLSDSGEALPSIAARRQTEPGKLTRLVRGELDWIVMKALEKDRARRYESASGFARDIERYLADEAVEACPPSRRYRLGKFVSKHRAALATAGIFAAVMITATAISAWQANRAYRALTAEAEQRRVAQNQRDRAQKAEGQARASQVKAESEEARAKRSAAESRSVLRFFLTRVVAAARPQGQSGGQGYDVTLRTALDAAERGIAADFAAQPAIEAAVRNTMGESYHYLGDTAKAVQQFQRVRSLRTAELGPDHHETLATMNNLAVAYLNAGRVDDAIRLQADVLELVRVKQGPDHAETLTSMSNLAMMYRDVGRTDDAIRLNLEVLALRKAKLGSDHAETLFSMNNLATAYADAGRTDDAIRLNKEALELRRAKLGPDHPETLQSLGNLAAAYQDAGRIDDAIRLNEEAIKLGKVKQGPDHPDTLTSMNNLAAAYVATRRNGDAIKVQEEVLALRKAKLGLEHFITLQSMNNLASMYLNEKRWAEAEALARECLELRKKTDPDDWPYFLTMSQVGLALAGQRKYVEAEPFQVGGYQGLKNREARIPDPLRKNLIVNATSIVRLYEAWGKPDKAEEWRKKLGPEVVLPAGPSRR